MTEETYKGLKIKIEYDESPTNPRDDEPLSTFAFFHKDFTNESDLSSDDFESLEAMREYIYSRTGLDALYVPAYLYNHGGYAFSTGPFSFSWDSGQLGFVYVTRKKAREWFGWKRITQTREDHVDKVLADELETYGKYVNGEVYGYVIEDLDESCWGYYDEAYCLEEAKRIVDHHLKHQYALFLEAGEEVPACTSK